MIGNLFKSLLLLGLCTPIMAADIVYEGTWITTKNRKLDGRMTCIATDLGKDNWKGRFYGIWQGVSFSYDVKWSGPPNNMKGTASIDGADYEWTGQISAQTPSTFKGTFTGNRYTGSFDLKEKK